MYFNWKLGLQVCMYSNSQLGKYLAKLIWGTCAAISYKIKLGRMSSLLEMSRVTGLCQGKY